MGGEVLTLSPCQPATRRLETGRGATHSGVAALGLAGLLGEDDQSALVLLQSVDVDLLSLLGLGSSSGVDGDADALGLLLSDTGELELRQGESSALCNPTSVTCSLLSDGAL